MAVADKKTDQGRQTTQDQNYYVRGAKISTKPEKADTAFRTISEVADELDVQQHVLRFWETKFTQVKPLKRGGGRRYYRPEDVDVLRTIRHLLYTEGYTIKGAQKLLKGMGKAQIARDFRPDQQQSAPDSSSVPDSSHASDAQPSTSSSDSRPLSERQKAILNSMLGELRDLRDMLKGNDNE